MAKAELQAEEDQERGTPRRSITVNTSGQPVMVSATDSPRQSASDDREPSSPEIKSPTDKSRGRRRVTSWFKSHFSKGSKAGDESVERPSGGSFVAGAALTGLGRRRESSTSIGNHSASMRAVAMAGREGGGADRGGEGQASIDMGSPSLSSSSGYLSDDRREQAGGGGGLSAPRPFRDGASAKSLSPQRDSRFREMM